MNCDRCGEPLEGDELPGLRGRRTDLRVPIEFTYQHRGIVVIWRCPACGFGWPRFPTGPLHVAAVKHLAGEAQARFERVADPSLPGRARSTPAEPLPEVEERLAPGPARAPRQLPASPKRFVQRAARPPHQRR